MAFFFLKRKVFKQAGMLPPIPSSERAMLARQCLEDGENAGLKQMVALAQAKLDYVYKVLEICAQYRLKVFASITSNPVRDTDDDTEDQRADYDQTLLSRNHFSCIATSQLVYRLLT